MQRNAIIGRVLCNYDRFALNFYDNIISLWKSFVSIGLKAKWLHHRKTYGVRESCRCQEEPVRGKRPDHCTAVTKVGTRSTRGFYSSCCFGSHFGIEVSFSFFLSTIVGRIGAILPVSSKEEYSLVCVLHFGGSHSVSTTRNAENSCVSTFFSSGTVRYFRSCRWWLLTLISNLRVS